MHKKNELESMSSDELAALAKSLGVKVINDQTELIYNIIDAESVQPVEKTEKKPETKPAVKPAEKPQKTPEKAEKPSPKDILEGKTSGNYFVQMGAFKTQAQADTQRAKLAQVGISSQIQQGKDKNGNTVYRVRSGSLNKADAEKIRDTAKNHKFDAMIVSQ